MNLGHPHPNTQEHAWPPELGPGGDQSQVLCIPDAFNFHKRSSGRFDQWSEVGRRSRIRQFHYWLSLVGHQTRVQFNEFRQMQMQGLCGV